MAQIVLILSAFVMIKESPLELIRSIDSSCYILFDPQYTFQWHSGVISDRQGRKLAHGIGEIQFYKNGRESIRYYGKVDYGNLSGYGVMYISNGNPRYFGTWKNSEFNGKGIYFEYRRNGLKEWILQGEWSNGRLDDRNRFFRDRDPVLQELNSFVKNIPSQVVYMPDNSVNSPRQIDSNTELFTDNNQDGLETKLRPQTSSSPHTGTRITPSPLPSFVKNDPPNLESELTQVAFILNIDLDVDLKVNKREDYSNDETTVYYSAVVYSENDDIVKTYKDKKRLTVVGTPYFGKSNFQSLYPVLLPGQYLVVSCIAIEEDSYDEFNNAFELLSLFASSGAVYVASKFPYPPVKTGAAVIKAISTIGPLAARFASALDNNDILGLFQKKITYGDVLANPDLSVNWAFERERGLHQYDYKFGFYFSTDKYATSQVVR